MNTKLYLVRHGFADFYRGDASVGKKQVEEVAEYFARLKLDSSRVVIISSQRERTIITAEAIKNRLTGSHTDAPHMKTDSSLNDGHSTSSYQLIKNYLFEDQSLYDAIIIISHQPNLEYTLDQLCPLWRIKPPARVANAEAYYIDAGNRAISRVFSPSEKAG
jgi:phosphohistidine phosphatase SixA